MRKEGRKDGRTEGRHTLRRPMRPAGVVFCFSRRVFSRSLALVSSVASLPQRGTRVRPLGSLAPLLEPPTVDDRQDNVSHQSRALVTTLLTNEPQTHTHRRTWSWSIASLFSDVHVRKRWNCWDVIVLRVWCRIPYRDTVVSLLPVPPASRHRQGRTSVPEKKSQSCARRAEKHLAIASSFLASSRTTCVMLWSCRHCSSENRSCVRSVRKSSPSSMAVATSAWFSKFARWI